MRLVIPSASLSHALAAVLPAISGRATVDTLRSALFAVEGDECVIAGTDMEVGVRVSVGVTDAAPGVCLAPPASLKEIADLSEGDVRLETDKEGLRVVTTAGSYDLPTADVNDWPKMDDPEGEPTLTLDGETLGTALSRVTFAAAREESKYAQQSVYWDLNGERLSLAATDGKRLAVVDMNAAGMGSMLVPPKAMAILAKLCEGEVKVWFPSGAKGLAHFHTPAGQLTTRLVEGRFPPYRDVIPKRKEIKGRATFPAGAFLHAVRSAAVMSDAESKRVSFAFSSGKVALAAQGATTGKAAVTFGLDYDGPALTVHLDPQYVVEFLRVMPAEEKLTLELVAGDKSVVFRAKDCLHLVVPLV